MSKKIAIIMSTYNGEKYIKEQIDSILWQVGDFSLDIFIRDDGSSDNTVKIIKQMQEIHKNIELYIGENVGYNESFFTLLKLVDLKYDYYSISDQDDIWKIEKIQTAIKYLDNCEDDGPVLYGSSSEMIDEFGKIIGKTQIQRKEITLFNCFIQNIIPGHNQVINKCLLKIIKNELEKKNINSDKIYVYDSWITCLAITCGKVIFNNEPQTLYRQHQNNALGEKDGFINWFNKNMQRVKNKEFNNYIMQMEYFYETHKDEFSEIEKNEITAFLNSRNCLKNRLFYVLNSKLYRQKKIETICFKIMYIIGKCSI